MLMDLLIAVAYRRVCCHNCMTGKRYQSAIFGDCPILFTRYRNHPSESSPLGKQSRILQVYRDGEGIKRTGSEAFKQRYIGIEPQRIAAAVDRNIVDIKKGDGLRHPPVIVPL